METNPDDIKGVGPRFVCLFFVVTFETPGGYRCWFCSGCSVDGSQQELQKIMESKGGWGLVPFFTKNSSNMSFC